MVAKSINWQCVITTVSNNTNAVTMTILHKDSGISVCGTDISRYKLKKRLQEKLNMLVWDWLNYVAEVMNKSDITNKA